MNLTSSAKTSLLVHPDCKEIIRQINRTKDFKLQFLYLRKLKDYYRDDYTVLDRKELTKIIPEKTFKIIFKQYHWDRSEQDEALRWIARGLPHKMAQTIIEIHKSKRLRSI